jgi:hypothetical protein
MGTFVGRVVGNEPEGMGVNGGVRGPVRLGGRSHIQILGVSVSMFDPMGEYERVIVMDMAMVQGYKAYLEAQGQRVDVLHLTVKELQEQLLTGYLYSTGQTN